MAGCGENSSEASGSVKCGEFLESPSCKGPMLHTGSQSVMLCEELNCSRMAEKYTKTITSSRKSSSSYLNTLKKDEEMHWRKRNSKPVCLKETGLNHLFHRTGLAKSDSYLFHKDTSCIA